MQSLVNFLFMYVLLFINDHRCATIRYPSAKKKKKKKRFDKDLFLKAM